MGDLVVAITGASGSIYAVRLLEVLLSAGRRVHVTISDSAAHVILQELGLIVDLDHCDPAALLPADDDLAADSKLRILRASRNVIESPSSVLADSDIDSRNGELVYHHYTDFSAGIASGSFATAGMVICPCSMGTLAHIANGMCTNLIHRAAEVHLKEGRPLIVVPRETPLSSIALENMQRLATAGAVVLPAMPGFYHNPVSIHDLVDFVVARICDQLQVPHELVKRWGSK